MNARQCIIKELMTGNKIIGLQVAKKYNLTPERVSCILNEYKSKGLTNSNRVGYNVFYEIKDLEYFKNEIEKKSKKEINAQKNSFSDLLNFFNIPAKAASIPLPSKRHFLSDVEKVAEVEIKKNESSVEFSRNFLPQKCGVYEVIDGAVIGYAFWDGSLWGLTEISVQDALDGQWIPAVNQDKEWRNLGE